jgi:tetratricopeptide (TPR) repeat protein
LLAIGHAYESDGQGEKALTRYARAVELAPEYWVAWMRLANSMIATGRYTQAANAYAKMLELKERCDALRVTPCPDALDEEDYWPVAIYNAGFWLLYTGRYAQAAVTLEKAFPLHSGTKKRNIKEWMAVALFGAKDIRSAWDTYRELFEGTPFPDTNDEGTTEAQARRAKTPPPGFYRLMRNGFLNLRNDAYDRKNLFYEYLHAQNVARAEAARTKATRKFVQPTPYESRKSREYLIALFNEIRKRGDSATTPSYAIQPALSRYAVANARKAEAAIARKDYHVAEDYYRMAVVTDPWWVHGQQNLLRLEFLHYGWCGPRGTLDILHDLDRLGIGPIPDSPDDASIVSSRRFIDRWEAELRDIWNEAAESGSHDLEGWCDIDSPTLSVIHPEFEVVE